jgi:peptidoglycan/LPS O-acetylase OafA/YrhL
VWHYLMLGLVQLLTNGEFTYGNVHDLGRFSLMSLTVLVMSYAIAAASWFWMEKPVLQSRWART